MTDEMTDASADAPLEVLRRDGSAEAPFQQVDAQVSIPVLEGRSLQETPVEENKVFLCLASGLFANVLLGVVIALFFVGGPGAFFGPLCFASTLALSFYVPRECVSYEIREAFEKDGRRADARVVARGKWTGPPTFVDVEFFAENEHGAALHVQKRGLDVKRVVTETQIPVQYLFRDGRLLRVRQFGVDDEDDACFARACLCCVPLTFLVSLGVLALCLGALWTQRGWRQPLAAAFLALWATAFAASVAYQARRWRRGANGWCSAAVFDLYGLSEKNAVIMLVARTDAVGGGPSSRTTMRPVEGDEHDHDEEAVPLTTNDDDGLVLQSRHDLNDDGTGGVVVQSRHDLFSL